MPTYINNLKIEKGANVYFSGLPLSLHKPKLKWHKDKISRFHYATLQTDLYERKNEFDILKNFVLSEDKFLWQTIHGEAGVGKSRLALELGLSLEKSWEWGFIGKERSLISDLNTLQNQWIPEKNILIIIDYATFYIELIRETIVTLKTRSDKWNYNIRLLICDRLISEKNDSNWYNRIKRSFSKTAMIKIEDSEFEKPILCKKISSKITQQIIESVLKNKYHNNIELPENLESILEEKRINTPLLALFFVEALIFSSEVVQFDSDLLKKWLLQFELERWKEQGIGSIEKRLMRLATLSNDLLADSIKNDELFIQEFKCDIHANINAINSILHGSDDNLGRLKKIEPDLLGEIFVLDSIEKELLSNQESFKILEDLNFIKRNKYIDDLYSFLLRSAEDFPFSKALSYLISKLLNLGIKPNQKNIMESIQYMSLELSERKNINDAKILCSYLEKQIFSKEFLLLIKNLSNRAECASHYFTASAILCTKIYNENFEKEHIENVYLNIKKYILSYSYEAVKSKFLLDSFGLIIVIYVKNNFKNKKIINECIEDLEKLLDFKDISAKLVEYYAQCIFVSLVLFPQDYISHSHHYFKIKVLVEAGYNIADTFIMFCTNMFQFSENFQEMNINTNDVCMQVHQIFSRIKERSIDLLDAYTRFIYNLLSNSPTLSHLKLDYSYIIENFKIINVDIEEVNDEKIITRYLNSIGHLLTCMHENKNPQIIVDYKYIQIMGDIVNNINQYNYKNEVLKEELENDLMKLVHSQQ